MQILIDKNIFRHLFWVMTLWCVCYYAIISFAEDTPVWDLIYFVNENLLLLSVLLILSRIIQEIRLKIFAYIIIVFKLILTFLNILAIMHLCEIHSFEVKIIVFAYWFLSLNFYIYVSFKRLHQ
jgi:hypothetical protein